jgi:hypothetical protein
LIHHVELGELGLDVAANGPHLDCFIWRLEPILGNKLLEPFRFISKLNVVRFSRFINQSWTDLELEFFQVLRDCIVQFDVERILDDAGWRARLDQCFPTMILLFKLKFVTIST